MSSKVKSGTDLLAIRILMTEECNLSCVFCHNEGQQGLTRVSDLDAAKLRTLLRAGSTRSLRQIKFSGGEPTLHPDLIDFVGFSVSSGYDTVIISNGVNRAELESGAALGARICINVPSVAPKVYRSLTGGDLEKVVETLESLRRIRAEVAINSYSPMVPNVEHIDRLLAFAKTYRCSLKLLLPCQVLTAEKQVRAHRDYRSALTSLNCSLKTETAYDSSWVTADSVRVRIVKPWCPETCRSVTRYYRSARLTPRLELRPCFGNSALGLPLDFSSTEACGASLDRALSLVSGSCGDDISIRVRHRRSRDTSDRKNAH
ncbi:MAG TPA: radical SAM protein [Amycolatopsis sp.]|uniref:radical SAM protein n=1 Tax=Amycolatopsis sp. TaxID=37632 RepID=UPI002B476826|nr:radical SAM protein [Amycolatopsis sp.]HKS45316.1 radical SAM protein [Amycolatopsis sp.]